ncbi:MULTISPECIES: FtsX-like permease family protein [unclassified Nocardioides]|uniref:FtsX-like permease family protein n=1 Tax=unclassified Nocardioides TaxID=2615069 RepID=UPI0007000F8E|nr:MULTISPECIES: ABC transporter permease [unclassified Nocardioides]KQY57098.1 hypothetical protein ASD30_12635 [Nocardioides sp. Root140]KRF11738.1 hypothetical protein ASH02_17280 [Nocardioides sp. Soil796]
MMLSLSRQNVRRNRALFAGSFVALGLGVALIALSTMLIWSVEEFTATVDPADEELLLALDDTMAMLGVVAGFSGFMAIFIVASTFGFAVTARQRELGLLRLIGATPRQVKRLVRGESLVVAAAAAAAGCVLGWLLTPVALWAMNRRGLAPGQIPLAAPWWPMVIAAGVGVSVAFVGAWIAARRAARIPAIQAMREASAERSRIGIGRALTGLLCLVGAVVMLVGIRAGNAELALALSIFVPQLLVIGLVCVGPLLMPLLVRLLTLGLRGNVLVALARENVLAMPRRTTSLAAPILAISGIAGTVILSLSFAADWDNGVTRQQLQAPVVVTGGDERTGEQLAARDDVGVADTGLLVPMGIGADGLESGDTAEGIDPEAAAAGRGTRAHRGDLSALTGKSMAVSRSFAWDAGVSLGDVVPVTFGDDARLELTVVAVVDDANTLQESVLVPRRLAEEHGGQGTGTWFVDPASGVTPAAMVSDLSRDLPDAEVLASEQWVADRDEETRANNVLSMVVVLGPSGVYAAIAIANTLLMGSLQRRHEFIATRLVGATEQQVRRLVVLEAGLVAGVALLLGSLITVGVAVLLRAPMTDGLHDVPLTIPWGSLLSIGVSCVVIAVVAAVAPARAILRGASPAQAAAG